MALGSFQPRTEMGPGIFLGLKDGRRLKLTTSPTSLGRLYGKYEIVDLSQPYGLPLPVTRKFNTPHSHFY
jgi:hypothetical protein